MDYRYSETIKQVYMAAEILASESLHNKRIVSLFSRLNMIYNREGKYLHYPTDEREYLVNMAYKRMLLEDKGIHHIKHDITLSLRERFTHKDDAISTQARVFHDLRILAYEALVMDNMFKVRMFMRMRYDVRVYCKNVLGIDIATYIG